MRNFIYKEQNKLIRITFISSLAYNYFCPGVLKQAGGHTRIYHLSKAFAKLDDYKVSCVVGDFGQQKIMDIDNVRLIKAPIENPWRALEVLAILRNIDTDIFIDFCASPILFLLYILKLICEQSKRKIKYIFLTASDTDVNGQYQKIENKIFYYLYLMGLKNADAIVAQTPAHKYLLKEKYKLLSEVIISPYVEIKKSEKCLKNTILWVGRSAYYKQPDLFLSLAKEFPDERFVMVCNRSKYDDNFYSSLRNNLKSLNNLQFYEYVPHSKIEGFFKEAKLLINTSLYEGFPNTFIEAAISYTPILSLSCDPNKMLSVHGAGICCNGNFDFMYKSLSYLLNDNALLDKMGQNAFNYAFENHRLSHAVEKFDKIFRRILHQQK